MRSVLFMFLVALLLTGCGGGVMRVSTVFQSGGRIPDEYTCKGRNVNPPLKITGIPSNAKTLAIIVDDPDAPIGTFVHWVAWNLEVKGSEMEIPKGVSRTDPSMEQGRNDFGRMGYDGPCPPPGHGVHHYHFKVYALDTRLNLKSGATKRDLERAMKGHVLESSEIVGTYSR